MSEANGMSLRDKMFSFDGRQRRQDYWLISIGLGLSVFFLTEIVMWSVFGRDYSLIGGALVQASCGRLKVGPTPSRC